MATIQFRSTNAQQLQMIAEQLQQDLQQMPLAAELQLSAPHSETEAVTRGDVVTWTMITLAAVGAGGALSVLLGKDGFLTALARVLEKYVAGRQAEVIIEDKQGKKITVRGPVGNIKEILQQIQREDEAEGEGNR